MGRVLRTAIGGLALALVATIAAFIGDAQIKITNSQTELAELREQLEDFKGFREARPTSASRADVGRLSRRTDRLDDSIEVLRDDLAEITSRVEDFLATYSPGTEPDLERDVQTLARLVSEFASADRVLEMKIKALARCVDRGPSEFTHRTHCETEVSR